MMKKIKLIIFIIPLFFITGCFNYRELNQLAITSAVGIDKEDDEYKITIQVLNTQKNGSDTNSSSNQTKFITYTATDVNLQEAFRKIIFESPKRIYANHISLLVIGEDVAEDGIYNILDLFFRDSESRKQFFVAIAKNTTANEVLNVLTPLETLNSKNIRDSITTDSEYLGVSPKITFEEVVNRYLDTNREIILPSIEVIGNEQNGDDIENIEKSSPETKVIVNGTAIFKDDNLVGYLSKDESIALSFITNKINNTVASYECDDNGYVAAELLDSDTSVDISKDPLKVSISIATRVNINEITCDLDIEDSSVIKEIEGEFEKKIEENINNTIKKIIEDYNTEVFGFRDMLYRNDPAFYKTIKDDWYDSFFPDLDYEVKVKIKLLEKGNTLKVIER